MEVDTDPARCSLSAVVTKRAPQRAATGKGDIYVARGSVHHAMVARAEGLLNQGEPAVRIHGMGALVGRAIDLALQLEERGKGSLVLETSTRTVTNVDDVVDMDTPSR